MGTHEEAQSAAPGSPLSAMRRSQTAWQGWRSFSRRRKKIPIRSRPITARRQESVRFPRVSTNWSGKMQT